MRHKRELRQWVAGTAALFGILMMVAFATPAKAATGDVHPFNPVVKTLPPPVKNAMGTNESVDQWMPDKNLQYIVLGALQDAGVNITETNEITQADMQQLTSINTAMPQRTDKTYWQAIQDVKTLKGLEYATNLTQLTICTDTNWNLYWTNNTRFIIIGQLADISALKNLSKLQSVSLQFNRISDISALANKSQLTDLSLSYNAITDVSPLANDPISKYTEMGFQTSVREGIVLNPNTKEITTPSYSIKNLKNESVPVKAYYKDDQTITNANYRGYYRNYTSTADGVNVDPTTLKWTNLQKDVSTSGIGFLTAFWDDDFTWSPYYTFAGAVITPYEFDQSVGNLFVNYQTDGGQDIEPQTILTGTLNDPYDLTTNGTVQNTIQSIKNQGYYLEKVNGSEKGNYTADGASVTYVFTKTPAAIKVPVHYLDANKKPIVGQADGELSGVPTDKLSAADFKSAQRTIAGYEYSHAEVDGQMVADPTTLTYDQLSKGLDLIYNQTAKAVNVKYVDENGDAIKDAAGQPITGEATYPDGQFVGQPYTTEQKTIAGYTFDKVDTSNGGLPATGTLTADGGTVTYIYKKNTPPVTQGTVIAKYVDESGKEIHAPITTTGAAGTDYTTTQLGITGYEFKKLADDSAPVKGQYTNGTQTVTYVYAASTPVEQYGQVITQFKDSLGNEIHNQVVSSGKVGTNYTTTPVTIDGYTYLRLADGSAAQTGLYINGTLTVTYIYQKNTPPVTEYGTVIAQYVDDQGHTIHDTITTRGPVGTNYATSQLAVDGYTFKQVAAGSAAVTGLYVNGTLTVTYVYTKNSVPVPELSKVIARYVDEQGNPIHDEIVTTGKVGDPYATSQLTIKGYTFKQLASDSAPIYGQYQKDTQVVTYIYSKIDTGGGDDGGKTPGTGGQGGDEQPTTPTTPTKPSQPGQGGGTATSPVETPTGGSQTARQSRLPQTDEDTGLASTLLTILGVTLLGIAAVSYRQLRD
ncbi:MucBP domain-containing protein [Schleiferilactobacillus perolens]|jgi:hypothetical protein|uniref:MucBP domain-containing protein n=1 Tax=Schleiferilactobacillus perolens TaxID=100468 RepID=UPI002356970D|nr:MucBP domain-containing protein [Schleiferilactobacillus perolens]MCI2172294.1 MucBP domain-containing protein [Schleiferilactobacillus perolens]